MVSGILAIGKTLTLAVLKPMERLLSLIAKIPGMGAVGDLADKIGAVEASMFPDLAEGSLTDQANSAIQVVPAPVARQELDVNMKIDAEGRPTIEKTESTGTLMLNTDIGFTYASWGI
jgi:hypothetical protein